MSGQVRNVVYALCAVLKQKQLAVWPATLTVRQGRSFRRSLDRVANSAEPADTKVETHQLSLTLFPTPTCLVKIYKKKHTKSSTNNLGVVSCHSSSAKQSQAAWGGRKGAPPQPVQACSPYRGVPVWLKTQLPLLQEQRPTKQPGTALPPPNQTQSRGHTLFAYWR